MRGMRGTKCILQRGLFSPSISLEVRAITQPPSSSGSRSALQSTTQAGRHPYSYLNNTRLYITSSSHIRLHASTLLSEGTSTYTYAYCLKSRSYERWSRILRAPKNGAFYRKMHACACDFFLQELLKVGSEMAFRSSPTKDETSAR